MTTEKAEKLCLILRQVREALKDALDNLEAIAEKAVMLFVNDESERKLLSSSVAFENRLLNIKEVAKRLGVSVKTVNNLQNEGLPKIKIGTRTLFDYEEVSSWLKENRNKNYRKKNLRVVR